MNNRHPLLLVVLIDREANLPFLTPSPATLILFKCFPPSHLTSASAHPLPRHQSPRWASPVSSRRHRYAPRAPGPQNRPNQFPEFSGLLHVKHTIFMNCSFVRPLLCLLPFFFFFFTLLMTKEPDGETAVTVKICSIMGSHEFYSLGKTAVTRCALLLLKKVKNKSIGYNLYLPFFLSCYQNSLVLVLGVMFPTFSRSAVTKAAHTR